MTPEETAVHLRLITNEELAAQIGQLTPAQHIELSAHLAQQYVPPTQQPPPEAAHDASLDLHRILSELAALRNANLALQARVDALPTTPVSHGTQDWADGFRELKEALSTSHSSHPTDSSSLGRIKVKEPDTFDGSRSEKSDIYVFVSQIKNYVLDTKGWADDAHRVRICAGYLRGKPYKWISSYLSLPDSERTSGDYPFLFNFETFCDLLITTWGDPDRQAADDRRLRQLRQTGSAAVYASEFRRLSLSLGWGDVALRSQFYEGLKEDLKDELSRLDPIKELTALISRVIQIDNRLFQRRLQKSGKTGYASSYAAQPSYPSFATDIRPEDRMQVDATRKAPAGRRGPLTPAEKERRRQNNLCTYCAGAGHYAGPDCPKLKKRDAVRASAARPLRTAAATFQIVSPHNATIIDAEDSGNEQRPTEESEQA
ncbi:hypothetical protein JCM10213_003325 [Rhodosporidiobolus nylandii]